MVPSSAVWIKGFKFSTVLYEHTALFNSAV